MHAAFKSKANNKQYSTIHQYLQAITNFAMKFLIENNLKNCQLKKTQKNRLLKKKLKNNNYIKKLP